jgi:putative membrane protein insertion efficiency factor
MTADTGSYKGMLLNRVLIGLIRLYRLLLSPFFGPACRFTPSCSCYAMDVLAQYPIHRALPRILYRLLRCNPLSKGGYDPVIIDN